MTDDMTGRKCLWFAGKRAGGAAASVASNINTSQYTGSSSVPPVPAFNTTSTVMFTICRKLAI